MSQIEFIQTSKDRDYEYQSTSYEFDVLIDGKSIGMTFDAESSEGRVYGDVYYMGSGYTIDVPGTITTAKKYIKENWQEIMKFFSEELAHDEWSARVKLTEAKTKLAEVREDMRIIKELRRS